MVICENPGPTSDALSVGPEQLLALKRRDGYGASATVFRPLRILGAVGDDLRRPLTLPPSGGVVRTNSVQATRQAEEVQRIGVEPLPERSLWWEWTASADGVLRCSPRGSSCDAQFIVLKATNAPAMQLVAWGRDLLPQALTESLKVPVQAQAPYLIDRRGQLSGGGR